MNPASLILSLLDNRPRRPFLESLSFFLVCREGQTLPVRKVPQKKPEARQDARTLVLPELSEAL